jgi:hypothetical protein
LHLAQPVGVLIELPHSCLSQWTGKGRDLPDADGPEFVALDGSFRAENRSLIGQQQA